MRRSLVGLAGSLVLALALLPVLGPPAAAQGPSLSILSPRNEEVIGNGSPVLVAFEVTNFVLVQPGRVGQGSPPTEGHVDLYVDGAYSRMLTRVEPVSLALPSGPHTIRMQLKANDGSALTPDVSVLRSVNVTQGPASGQPTIRFTSPVPDEETGHDVYFAIEVTNFALVEPRGQPNAPNEGHVEMSLDNVFQQVPRAEGPTLMVDLSDGVHTVTARLVNNDGTPLSPDVSSSVTIRVKGAPDPTPSAMVTGGISGILGLILVVLLLRRRKAAARFAMEGGSEGE